MPYERSAMLRTRFLTGRLVAMVILLLIGIAILLPAASTLALGSIVYDGSPGTDAPPATLGPYTMTPFTPDTRDLFIDVTTIPVLWAMCSFLPLPIIIGYIIGYIG